MKAPDLSNSFPGNASDLKIKSDLGNPKHGGPHYDVLQSIPGGTEQIRVTDGGDVLGGTTNIGKAKIGW